MHPHLIMSEPAKKITRQELYTAVWSRPIKTLAQEWNTTYLRVVQACLEMEVPRPCQGHWQMIALGRTVASDPLPEREKTIPSEVELLPRGVRREKKGASAEAAPVDVAEPKGQEVPKVTTARQDLDVKSPVPKTAGQEFDLSRAAEQAVLDIIRQARRIDFWEGTISECHRPCWLAEWLGLEEGVRVPEGRLVSLLKSGRKEYRTFQVKVEETKDRYNPSELLLSVEIGLREDYEWKDAWEEAWTFADHPNPHCLSDNALRLYQWAKGPKNTGKMTERRRIGAQARLRKTYFYMEDHLREIRLKADSTICWEKEGHIGQESMRIWFEKGQRVHYYHGPLNPALGLDLRKVEHQELERFKGWLHGDILKPGFPDETEIVAIFDIRDLKTLKAAFSGLPAPCGFNAPDPHFFDALRLVQGVQIEHSFLNGAGPWLVTCEPEEGVTWKDVKERLRAQAKEIPLEKKYSLSVDSVALLRWILSLRDDEHLQGLTPTVEDHLQTDIGIQTKWRDENTRAYLELLIEEINEKTEFNLRTVGWHHYSRELTRILVKKKQADLEAVVRAVQVLALSTNGRLDADRVRTAITHLLAE